jgi:hypothetical protein
MHPRISPKLRPISRSVYDAKDEEHVVVNFIDEDVAGLGDALFPRAVDTAWATGIVLREFVGGILDASDKCFADAGSRAEMIFGNAVKIGAGSASPN